MPHSLPQATAAFDGIQESKWEEPNGAKGMKYSLIQNYDICYML